MEIDNNNKLFKNDKLFIKFVCDEFGLANTIIFFLVVEYDVSTRAYGFHSSTSGVLTHERNLSPM